MAAVVLRSGQHLRLIRQAFSVNSYSTTTSILQHDGHTPSSISSEDEGDPSSTRAHRLPPSPSSSALVRDIHRLIINNPATGASTSAALPSTFTIPSLSSALSRLSPTPLPSPLLHHLILTSSSNPRHFPQTLALFNWWLLSSTPSPSDLSDPYHAIVDFAGKAHAFSTAWSLLSDMLRLGFPITTRTCLQLVRRYARAGLPAEAADAFRKLEDDGYGFQPDANSFSSALAALSRSRSSGPHAQALFDRLRSRIPPDVVSYTALIHAWCRTNRFDEAERVFTEMQSCQISPNVYTYTVVIEALCRAGQIGRAHEVFAQMLSANCPPNAATFNAFLGAHVRAGRTEKALEIFNQMKRMGCAPDAITYNFVIDAHCRQDNMDAALKVLNLMASQANAASFNPIFRGAAKLGDLDTARKLYAKMEEIGCDPNVVTYNLLFGLFGKSKSVDMVMRMKKVMEEKGVKPNVDTYGTLIPMFCEMGNWNQAYQLFLEMLQDKGLKPRDSTTKMVLTCLRKAGKLQRHDELVEKLVALGFLLPRGSR